MQWRGCLHCVHIVLCYVLDVGYNVLEHRQNRRAQPSPSAGPFDPRTLEP